MFWTHVALHSCAHMEVCGYMWLRVLVTTLFLIYFIDLQCANFCCTVMMQLYIYIHSFSCSFSLQFIIEYRIYRASPVAQTVKHLPAIQETRKRSVSIPTPKKSSVKECSDHGAGVLISHTSMVLTILQARLQQYVNQEIPYVLAGFRKGKGTRAQTANIR